MTESASGKPEIPTHWHWVTIGDVADTASGGTPSRSNSAYFVNGSIPWVKSGELRDTLITESEEYITEQALNDSSAKVFERGTPLVALYGATVGRTGILGMDAATNQAVCAILAPKETLDAKYLVYWLFYQRPELIEKSAGGAQPNISQGIVRSHTLPLAPLTEQHRIVDAIEAQFTRLDAAIAALKRAQANLERYKASVLQSACEGRLVPTEAELARREGRDYEPAEVLLERILAERRRRWEADRWADLVEGAKKQAAQAQRKAAGRPSSLRDLADADWQELAESEYAAYLPKSDNWKAKYEEPDPPDTEGLPALPEGWVWATVERLSSGEKYSTAIGPFGSNLKVADYQDSGVPLVFVRDIRSRRFGGPDTQYVSAEKAEELSAHRVIGGEILITKMGDPPGDASFYPDDRPPAVITSDCIKWTLSAELTAKLYFVQVFATLTLRRQINKITRGVAQKKVSLTRAWFRID